ncbi:MAG: hypothetical protein WC570_03200 [Patescibacteria group bacterium]
MSDSLENISLTSEDPAEARVIARVSTYFGNYETDEERVMARPAGEVMDGVDFVCEKEENSVVYQVRPYCALEFGEENDYPAEWVYKHVAGYVKSVWTAYVERDLGLDKGFATIEDATKAVDNIYKNHIDKALCLVVKLEHDVCELKKKFVGIDLELETPENVRRISDMTLELAEMGTFDDLRDKLVQSERYAEMSLVSREVLFNRWVLKDEREAVYRRKYGKLKASERSDSLYGKVNIDRNVGWWKQHALAAIENIARAYEELGKPEYQEPGTKELFEIEKFVMREVEDGVDYQKMIDRDLEAVYRKMKNMHIRVSTYRYLVYDRLNQDMSEMNIDFIEPNKNNLAKIRKMIEQEMEYRRLQRELFLTSQNELARRQLENLAGPEANVFSLKDIISVKAQTDNLVEGIRYKKNTYHNLLKARTDQNIHPEYRQLIGEVMDSRVMSLLKGRDVGSYVGYLLNMKFAERLLEHHSNDENKRVYEKIEEDLESAGDVEGNRHFIRWLLRFRNIEDRINSASSKNMHDITYAIKHALINLNMIINQKDYPRIDHEYYRLFNELRDIAAEYNKITCLL